MRRGRLARPAIAAISLLLLCAAVPAAVGSRKAKAAGVFKSLLGTQTKNGDGKLAGPSGASAPQAPAASAPAPASHGPGPAPLPAQPLGRSLEPAGPPQAVMDALLHPLNLTTFYETLWEKRPHHFRRNAQRPDYNEGFINAEDMRSFLASAVSS
eukprot:SAG22_NODE_9210_length_603_cov_0.706349_1_plen_154_part_01